MRLSLIFTIYNKYSICLSLILRIANLKVKKVKADKLR